MYEHSIWIVKVYGTSKWTLKHNVTTLELFGKKNIEIGTEIYDAAYRVIAVHPEWNIEIGTKVCVRPTIFFK
jgi:hypothetical protein